MKGKAYESNASKSKCENLTNDRISSQILNDLFGFFFFWLVKMS